MIPMALTDDGPRPGKIWRNDHTEKVSRLVNVSEVYTACHLTKRQFLKSYRDLGAVNADLNGVSFSETPKYSVAP